jgi:zinc and cadmium transporter
MPTLLQIILACLAGGAASLLVAALLAWRVPQARLGAMVAFAAGAMLAAALLDILPEAFESEATAQALFGTLLAGLIGFYTLERLALWRHEHHLPGADTDAPTGGELRAAPWAVLLGDGVHNFVDGLLIAAAFLADPWLGVTTTLAVIAHEIPQELGEFLLLRAAGWHTRTALLANGTSSLAAVAGGIVGWWALDGARELIPYALAISAASFLYIAVADLMPMLHRRRREDRFLTQSGLLAAGLIAVPLLGHFAHSH